MPERPRWFDRKFDFDLPVWMAPNLVERLRGTAARLEERLRPVPRGDLVRRPGGRWSAQEHAGHLADLEPLFATRLDELEAGARTLAAADLENRRTHEAHHNERPLEEVLAGFRRERTRLVERLEAVPDALWERSALHPRLQTPMRLVDLALFVAEHDDHHLACITECLRAARGGR